MSIQKYSDYLQVNPSFESVVDIAADTRNKNLWREYIVGDDMEKLVDCLCQTLGRETPDSRRSIWIHGSYGTGKSYAAILVKHLLEEKKEVVDTYLENNQKLSKFRNRFLNCRNDNEDYLVIWKTGCTGIRTGDQLLFEVEFAIRDALRQKYGDAANYGTESLQDGVKEQLHSRNINWENILETTFLGEDYPDFDALVSAVDSGDLKAVQAVAEVIRQNHWGLISNVETFKKWIEDIVIANHLENSGIFFIWDEFTDYLRHSDDQVVMQQLSEFCKEQPLFMCFIVHKDASWVDAMGNATYQQITHRFHEVEFHVSPDATYDLIAGSISVRNGMDNNWKEARKIPLQSIRKYLPEIAGLDEKVSKKIEEFCPIHPMTIKLLSIVAENFAAAQRTMFRFMKDSANENQGFVGYISQKGPQDQWCWLTPDWLWDYFFTRESDFHDKETKVPEYIRHYEEKKDRVQQGDNEAPLCVFKVAMLLMAVMSTTKGIYTSRRSNNGISATVDCLKTCLKGVLSEERIEDYLKTFTEEKILLCDEYNGERRLQLPFRMIGENGLQLLFDKNDKKYSRYQMFAKDGKLATEFEKKSWIENDAISHRMKIAVCCAETISMDKRTKEVIDEIDKYPYKLGLLYVTVKDDAQCNSIQQDLANRARESGNNRFIIALVRTPFTDDMRKQWLTSLTKAEMARDNGHTADAATYEREATTTVGRWVSDAIGGRFIAWCGEKQWPNLYGVPQLVKTIQSGVVEIIFPYAPESIVITNTVYKSCNDSAPLAGVQRESKNSQLLNVLSILKQINALEAQRIQDVEQIQGSKGAKSVSALAEYVRERMESGQKVVLNEVWSDLQKQPFGYYNTIVCGVLLGFVFSFYKNSAYSWTDSAQGTFALNESTIKTLVLKMNKGQMGTDYLSAGSQTWQKFRDYIKKIFNISDGQTANETEGMRSVRECIIQVGAPFWSLKYLTVDDYGSEIYKKTAEKIIDNIQVFITQEGNTDEAMASVLQLFAGTGKLRERIAKSFQAKDVMYKAFTNFLFEVSPDLRNITEQLSVHIENLRDKVFSVMQNAIYTWTEEQVKEKIPSIISEYNYLDVLNNTLGKVYHSIEDATKDLNNAFNYMRVSIPAIKSLQKPWYKALSILRRVSLQGISQMTNEEKASDIEELKKYGSTAWECIQDAKTVLSEILEQKQIICSEDEVSTIYGGLKDITCDSSENQFNRELELQINNISQARNRVDLLERWRTISSTESVRDWCTKYGVPLLWIVSRDSSKHIRIVMSVENGEKTLDYDVKNSIHYLNQMDVSILNNDEKIEEAFLKVLGENPNPAFKENKDQILAELKLKLGNNISQWFFSDVVEVQKVLKKYQKERARSEKLKGTQENVMAMKESDLKNKVAVFLNVHPEFCDDFN